ncbi:hypothetical protein [Paenibacillus lupini]|uniref:hypothetical protein n=1 Tax=Paenibacillus lupini TaxID=1450204 RepID=UPI00141E620B|nr:hypothetical protein [Paenibacillus lupini]NIK21943.1 hypothetical protein [Paenibacillus lupini]
MSIVLLLLSFLSLTAVQPGSGQYVVTILSIWMNSILSGCIILVTVWRKMRESKRRRNSDDVL